MAEFTKGELKECKDSPGLLQIDGKTLFCVFPTGCNTAEEIMQKKANSNELLKRWSSQPDLYAACKAVEHELKLLKTRKLDVLPMVIAALSKADKKKGE